MGSAFDANFRNHRIVLAGQGIVCVGVEFRNSIGGLVYGPDAVPAPFPIGVNDCMAGLEHIASNKEKYKISTIVLNGESGGGNLACATALLAKRQGKLQMVDGVYANCPYIGGDYGEYTPTNETLMSLWENTESRSANPGKVSGIAKAMVDVYTAPGSKGRDDCVAWPLKA